MLADSVVEILVCPKTKRRLIYFPRGAADRDEAEGFLLQPDAGLRYRIEAGVPVLLIEEAEVLTADATAQLVTRARELGLVPA